jgi:hypothetical protein
MTVLQKLLEAANKKLGVVCVVALSGPLPALGWKVGTMRYVVTYVLIVLF